MSATDRRLAVVRRVLVDYRASQLVQYVRWVFDSDDRWARFMRDPAHPYLEVDNLFRRRHLAEHLPAAEAWSVLPGGGAAPATATYGDRSYGG